MAELRACGCFLKPVLEQRSKALTKGFYLELLQKGMQPEMARLTLARKIAAIARKIWKKGEMFNPKQLAPQAA
jgi:hypothetical protein